MKESFNLKVNHSARQLNAYPDTPLLYVLRNNLGINGPKFGCGLGQCGACMVLLDGKAVASCVIPVKAVGKREITTLEGITLKSGELHPVQQAFVDEQAAQCGYCLNGMVISSVALLNEVPKPGVETIKNKLQLHICRCGTHSRVIRAVKRASNA